MIHVHTTITLVNKLWQVRFIKKSMVYKLIYWTSANKKKNSGKSL